MRFSLDIVHLGGGRVRVRHRGVAGGSPPGGRAGGRRGHLGARLPGLPPGRGEAAGGARGPELHPRARGPADGLLTALRGLGPHVRVLGGGLRGWAQGQLAPQALLAFLLVPYRCAARRVAAGEWERCGRCGQKTCRTRMPSRVHGLAARRRQQLRGPLGRRTRECRTKRRPGRLRHAPARRRLPLRRGSEAHRPLRCRRLA
mmetsp:Transcript_81894/g.235303  ORF Transcript_81894/g.235303 Transcript_81894/m.235303 type:complete len:202 (+) Transcript_81894:687-1292(+)